MSDTRTYKLEIEFELPAGVWADEYVAHVMESADKHLGRVASALYEVVTETKQVLQAAPALRLDNLPPKEGNDG